VLADVGEMAPQPLRHADAVAWDLLTLLRLLSDPQAPIWTVSEPPPRWLQRAAATRFWFRAPDGPPTGYLELLQAVGMEEGLLAVAEDADSPRVIAGPNGPAWRSRPFPALTARLRERWLRLPRWHEGEPASIVDVWGADWRGFRSRLLFALADAEIDLRQGDWVTLDSLSRRIAARFPALLGKSFTAATARLAGEAGAGGDEREARLAAVGDIIAFELSGPFVWFALTEVADVSRRPRAVRFTPVGAALAARKPITVDDTFGADQAPLAVAATGEITLRVPSPHRVWALSAFTEPVDLGQESHYRLTSASVHAGLSLGLERGRIVSFLERESGGPLPQEVAGNLIAWARGYRRARLSRAAVVTLEDPADRTALVHALQAAGWSAHPLGDESILVWLPATEVAAITEERLCAALRDVGLSPHWAVVEHGTDGIAADSDPAAAGPARATGDRAPG
jgi:hypothetical protein